MNRAALAARSQALPEIHRLLNAAPTDREAQWWASLTKGERRTLLRHSGQDTAHAMLMWRQLTPDERRGVLTAARRAAAWGRTLLRRLQQAEAS